MGRDEVRGGYGEMRERGKCDSVYTAPSHYQLATWGNGVQLGERGGREGKGGEEEANIIVKLS